MQNNFRIYDILLLKLNVPEYIQKKNLDFIIIQDRVYTTSKAKNSISKTLSFKESNKSPIKTVSCESVPLINWVGNKSLYPWAFFNKFEPVKSEIIADTERPVVWESRICEKIIYVKPRTKEAGRQGLVQHVEYGLGMFKAEQSRSEVNAKEKIKQTREFTFTLLVRVRSCIYAVLRKQMHSYFSRHGVPVVSDNTDYRDHRVSERIQLFSRTRNLPRFRVKQTHKNKKVQNNQKPVKRNR